MEIFFEDKKHKEEKIDRVQVQERQDKRKSEEENKYENYNEAEGNEKNIHEKLEGNDNSKMTRAYEKNIEYDMRAGKKEVKMKAEDKQEMEKMRRWIVKIYNIYITPLKDMLDPFIQFTIGGNFMVEVYKTKKGQTYKVPNGTRGYADKTEISKNVDKLERRPFDKVIDIEMRMSYSMISKQKMMVELWDYNSIWMNTIKAYTTVDLMEIVNGNCNVSIDLTTKESGKKNPIPYAIIEFKCVFQEIWDFKLSFLNWKAGCIIPPSQAKKPNKSGEKYPNSQIEVELAKKDLFSFNIRTLSEEAINTDTPMWSNFEGFIVYRGTSSELENEDVIISLYDSSSLFKKKLSEKIVNLRGILEFERLKTEMTLLDEEDEKEKYYVSVEGFVNIPNRPRYRQSGENVVLFSSKKYLCINIMRVENIRPAETRGIVDSFISVEWCGIVQRTRTIKENNNPSFNETIYFQVPMSEEYIRDPEKYVQKINEEFVSKNEMIFNLMIEGDDNTYDNLGIAFFHLSDLKNGDRQQKKYFADDLKTEKKYVSRIYTGKSKLVSAFSLSNNTYVHYEAWFLDDFPAIIDFGEKKKQSERADKIPMELQPFFEGGRDIFLDRLKRDIQKVFSKYTHYFYKERMFTEVKPSDQYKNLHLLPYYLSLITMPEKIYSREDMTKDPNFFDCNLSTLDEIAHYVRCFPYSSESGTNEVWSSPDFTMKIRKGGVEDHAILMACLMMGLKKTKSRIKYYEIANDPIERNGKTNGMVTNTPTSDSNTIGATTIGNTNQGTADLPTPENEIVITQMYDKITFPYENRVFVCLGKLKVTREPYIWVMTVSDDYRDIVFWDPKLFKKYELQGRVDDSDRLKNFLLGKYPDYDSVKRGKVIAPVQEESDEDDEVEKPKKKKDLEEIKLKGVNEDSVLEYKESEDGYQDQQMNERDHLLVDIDIVAKSDEENAFSKLKFVNPLNIDENLTYDKEQKNKFSFLEEQKNAIDADMKQGNEMNLLPVEIFRSRQGKILEEKFSMPYETIDIIFNRNNIYANFQYHDPMSIKYNLYDNECWRPYIYHSDTIWRGKFEPFYSLTNPGPCYSPGLVNKMKESLIKEMRVGLTAARSGKNLQTKFKKKNEHINKILQKYCDHTEDRSLNRISEKEFDEKTKEWEQMIRSKIPKFYRMEARIVFFNFYEPEIIRRCITEDMEYFYNSKIKNLMFATSAKVYSYLNQIVSVRIILAKFYKIPLEDIADAEEERVYKDEILTDPTQLVEEEQDSDDDDEEALKFIELQQGNNQSQTTNNLSPDKKSQPSEIKPTKEVISIIVENK